MSRCLWSSYRVPPLQVADSVEPICGTFSDSPLSLKPESPIRPPLTPRAGRLALKCGRGEHKTVELWACYLIFRHAPSALFAGRYEPEEPFAVYGIPARLIGAALLSLVGFAIGDVVYWGLFRGAWDWPKWYA